MRIMAHDTKPMMASAAIVASAQYRGTSHDRSSHARPPLGWLSARPEEGATKAAEAARPATRPGQRNVSFNLSVLKLVRESRFRGVGCRGSYNKDLIGLL